MNKASTACSAAILLAAIAGNQLLGAGSAAATTATFTYTGGAQTFTVPGGVTSLTIDARGGAGGVGSSGSGGLGGQAVATMAVAPGDVIQIMVGGKGSQGAAGWNGGGAPGAGSGPTVPAAGGGGASDVRTGACAATTSCAVGTRVLVAGGGGGADTSGISFGVAGGTGGGTSGGNGNNPGGMGIFGAGGTGAGGAAGGNGGGGSLGQGGGGGAGGSFGFNGGAGGGGGYYGGGGGGGGTSSPEGGNGGGGSALGPFGAVLTSGVNANDGVVTISYTASATTTATTIASSSAPSPSAFGQAVTFTAAVIPVPTGGAVQFEVDGLPVGAPVAVDGAGHATSAPMSAWGVGTYSIGASFSGDPSYLPSAATPVGFSVVAASTTATVAASPANPAVGQAVTYTAHVSVVLPGAGTPTGTVAFAHDGTPMAGCGAVSVDSSQNAACTFTETAAGSHTIGATSSGSANLGGSTGTTVVTVQAAPGPGTTTTLAPTTAATTISPTTAAPRARTTTTVRGGPRTTAARGATSTSGPGGSAPTSAGAAPTTAGSRPSGGPTTTAAGTTTTQATPTASAARPGSATVDVIFQVAVHAKIGGTSAMVAGSGFRAGTAVTVTMHSTPRTLGALAVGRDGTFSGTVTFPADGLEPGAHHIDVTGLAPEGADVTHTWYLAVDPVGTVTHLERQPSDVPPAWVDALSAGDALPRYIVTEHPRTAVGTMVSGFAMLTMLAAGGSVGALRASAGGMFSVRRGAGRPTSAPAGGGGQRPVAGGAADDGDDGGSMGTAEIDYLDLRMRARAIGDRSPTWRWPGVGIVDRTSERLPAGVAPASPLAARILTDGTYLRAMFGSLWAAVPIAGAVLGAVAAVRGGGSAAPPTFALLTAILVLSAFDALAGGLAASVFTIGAVVTGHVVTLAGVRGLLGIDLLFVAVPLAAAAARPLRRAPGGTAADHADRAGDVVIAALVAAWTAKALVEALPGLAGVAFPVATSSGRIALAVLAAMVVRMVGETAAARWYPRRLDIVSPAAMPDPSTARLAATTAVQTLLLLFVAGAYLGNVWELYVGAAVFAVPQLIGLVQDRLPNLPWLVRALPGGIVRTTLLVVVGTWFASFVSARIDNPARMITLGFVLLSLPGLALTVPSFFARDGERWELTWAYRVAGAGVVIIGVLAVQNVVSFG